MISTTLSLSVLAAAAVAQKCAEVPTEDYLAESGKEITYPSLPGFYQGKDAWYWEFGPRSAQNGDGKVAVIPIWVPVFENGDSAGSNIIDIMPCEDGYSDVWEVNVVTVPDGTEVDSIRSAEALTELIEAEDLNVEQPGKLVNCPVVPAGSEITDSSPADGEAFPGPDNDGSLTPGWYKDQPIFYFDFGEIEDDHTEPVWVLQTESDGKDTKGAAGLNIIDTVPGESNFTPMWEMVVVTVPDDLEANTVQSAEAVVDADYDQEFTGKIVNCPVAFVASEVNEPGETGSGSGDSDDDDADAADAGASQAGMSIGLTAIAAILAL